MNLIMRPGSFLLACLLLAACAESKSRRPVAKPTRTRQLPAKTEVRIAGEVPDACGPFCERVRSCLDLSPSNWTDKQAASLCSGWCQDLSASGNLPCQQEDTCETFRSCIDQWLQDPSNDKKTFVFGWAKYHPAQIREGKPARLFLRASIQTRPYGDPLPAVRVFVHRADSNGRPLGPALAELYNDGQPPDRKANDALVAGYLPVRSLKAGRQNLILRGHPRGTAPALSKLLPVTFLPDWARSQAGSLPRERDRGTARTPKDTEFVIGMVMLQFKPQVSYEKIREVLVELNAKVIGHLAYNHTWTFHVDDSDGSETLKAIEYLKDSGLVVWAHPNFLFPVELE